MHTGHGVCVLIWDTTQTVPYQYSFSVGVFTRGGGGASLGNCGLTAGEQAEGETAI